jgi:hypothetical protein
LAEPFRPTLLLQALVRRGVDFVVIGGIAAVAYGSARNTFDLDITYAADPANLEALGRALIDVNARSRGVEEDVPFTPDGATLRRTEILTLDTDYGPFDVLARPPGIGDYSTLRQGANRVDVGGAAVLVASVEHMIEMKRAAGRPKDLLDIEELEAIRRLTRDRGRARTS